MRLVSFLHEDADGYGVLDGDRILQLNGLPGAPPDLKSALGDLDALTPLLSRAPSIAGSDVVLAPPITAPGKVLCVATNFREDDGAATPDYPLTFNRFAASLTGHEQPILKPDVSEMYDFEGELAVVIGAPGYRISRDDAMHHVAGYACFNDGSVRDWQRHSTQFLPGKNFYRSGSFGPCLVTADEIPDPSALSLETRVNGIVMQSIGMDRMIFDIPWLIAYFSTFTPLDAGDVIATGTPKGFGATRDPKVWLKPGDRVEVEVPGVGLLANTVTENLA